MTTTTHAYVFEHKTSSEDIEPGSPYWDALQLDTQISNYLEGMRALGFDPLGVMWDVIRKLALEPKKATPLEKREWTKEKTRACPFCKKKGGELTAPHEVSLGAQLGEGLEVASAFGEIVLCEGGQIVTAPPRLKAHVREHDETLDAFRERCLDEVTGNLDKYFQRRELQRLEQDEHESALDMWLIGRQIAEAKRLDRFPRTGSACRSYNRMCEYHGVCTGRARLDDDTLFETTKEHAELHAPRKHSLPILSTSSAKAFQKCARYYYHVYVALRRPREKSHALRFGTLFHVGLEVWWRTCDPVAAILAMHEAAAEHLIDEWDMAKAEALLVGYDLRWRNEPWKVEHVEIEFEAPLINPVTQAPSKTWVRGGKLDAVTTSVAV